MNAQEIFALSQEQMQAGVDWREEQNEKAQYKGVRIRDLYPCNYHQQKDKFFQKNENYNPHFLYKTIVSPEVIHLHTDHQQLALKILINNVYEHPQLPVMTEEQVMLAINEYLKGLGLEEYVEVKLEGSCLSRTSVAFFKEKIVLKVRTPLQYNKVSLEGVLNHQIGTHVIRTLNHRENCVRRPTDKAKTIQEGLAAINQLLPEERPFLFKAALRYLAAIYASKYDFINLFKQLKKYVKDQDDCWRECVRVKRGMGSTENPGGYYKDQNYLIGSVEIIKERKQIDFRKIFYGKLTPAETKTLQSGVLPPFLDTQQKFKHYLKKLDAIAICNFIE